MTKKAAFGGAIRKVLSQAAGRAAPRMIEASSVPAPAGRGLKGALSRVASRVAPQSQKNPQPVKRLPRNSGPIKAGLLAASDGTISETGEGLRKIVGKIASARGRGYKEGGKVGTAMTALQQLAKKYRAALDMDDTEAASRISRQMERMEPGSSKKITDSSEGARKEKLATFAEGGKVSKGLWALKNHLGEILSVSENHENLQNIMFRINDRGNQRVSLSPASKKEIAEWESKTSKFAKGGKVQGLKRLYEVYEKKSGKVIGKPTENADQAMRRRDRLDRQAGSYVHAFRETHSDE